MRISEAFPSKYLKATDLQDRPVTLEISHVAEVDVGTASDPQVKPVLYFKGKDKGLVLNKTNASTIASKYGDECDDWTGHLVEIFPTTTQFQGKTVECIRVRIPVPAADDEPDELPF